MGNITLASRLTRRIAIEEPVDIPDGGGGFIRSWQHVADVWAEIIPVRGREAFSASQRIGVVNYRITLRYVAGITTAMRVVYAGRYFDISAVINEGEKNISLQLLAEEEVGV